MKTLYIIIILSTLVGLSFQENKLSLKDYDPSDSGTWYFERIKLSFMYPLPPIPVYKIDCELVDVPGGKEVTYALHAGEGVVRGKLVDTDKENQSTCHIETWSTGIFDPLVEALVEGFCRHVQSIKRTSPTMTEIVVPYGKDNHVTVFVSRNKPKERKRLGVISYFPDLSL